METGETTSQASRVVSMTTEETVEEVLRSTVTSYDPREPRQAEGLEVRLKDQPERGEPHVDRHHRLPLDTPSGRHSPPEVGVPSFCSAAPPWTQPGLVPTPSTKVFVSTEYL